MLPLEESLDCQTDNYWRIRPVTDVAMRVRQRFCFNVGTATISQPISINFK